MVDPTSKYYVTALPPHGIKPKAPCERRLAPTGRRFGNRSGQPWTKMQLAP